MPAYQGNDLQMTIPLDHQLIGRRLVLRRFAESDAVAAHAILADREVARWLRRAKFPARADETAAWIRQHESEWVSGTAYRFAVCLEGRVLGCADVADISSGIGVLGYWLEQASWGRGFAGEAACLVRDFAFQHAGLHRIVAGHAAGNVASGRILLRAGFEPTGDDVLYYPLLDRRLPYRRYALDIDRSR
ncbi:MAG TPA: GNAT family N-acetyltransferase [Nitrobacter sp.]|nr:GNAT family N-acetyltransferase [Nitrobacter sp.]